VGCSPLTPITHSWPLHLLTSLARLAISYPQESRDSMEGPLPCLPPSKNDTGCGSGEGGGGCVLLAATEALACDNDLNNTTWADARGLTPPSLACRRGTDLPVL
jgi:hypothetical protein